MDSLGLGVTFYNIQALYRDTKEVAQAFPERAVIALVKQRSLNSFPECLIPVATNTLKRI